MNLIGAAPEAYEAALLQTYGSGANPIMDALRGKISVRQLRVMLEHLPANNAASRELSDVWGDEMRIHHDTNTQIRNLLALTYNIHRGKGAASANVKPLPTPESAKDVIEERTPEQIQEERDYLQSVLNRPNPH